ncbi:uncharacterized protein LOC122814414 [Protopterus annectens]|uniref:uncharacterized protein LOC122814414 n=1 Tax=Protopterus annectens TaxID=7888 RepID=UPI001CF9E11C|nr:uncharacterized protein LOC122814414 [Protopterus annectens]
MMLKKLKPSSLAADQLPNEYLKLSADAIALPISSLEDVFNLEKYIKQQFAELHQFLLDKEQQLIQQLKTDEANTLKWMEGNLKCKEIVTYLVMDSNGNLELKIKEEDSLKIMEENVKSVENDAVAIKGISHSNMEIRQPEPVGLLTDDVFNLEKYIKQEFAELHQFLLDKEEQLIQQLKNDEANTLKWMEGNLECIKQEIVTYLVTDSDGNLEDKIKEEDSLKIMEENVKSVEADAMAIKGISHSNMEIRQPEPVGLLTVPETFEDVTVTFTEEEWKLLRKQDKELYRHVMVQNYETCVSVGLDDLDKRFKERGYTNLDVSTGMEAITTLRGDRAMPYFSEGALRFYSDYGIATSSPDNITSGNEVIFPMYYTKDCHSVLLLYQVFEIIALSKSHESVPSA